MKDDADHRSLKTEMRQMSNVIIRLKPVNVQFVYQTGGCLKRLSGSIFPASKCNLGICVSTACVDSSEYPLVLLQSFRCV